MPQMRDLLERHSLRPPLCPHGSGRPVARELRVPDQLLHRSAELAVERRPLVLDPAAESLAAYVLRALEEVSAPARHGFLHAPVRQVALERYDVEADHTGGDPHRVRIDVNLVREHLLELQQRLAE